LSQQIVINDEKYRLLQNLLRGLTRVVIAYSGGVDSAFLLRAAIDTLGAEQVLAIIGDSPSYPSREGVEAIRLAKEMHAIYRVIQTGELQDPRYAANPSDRCYYCKHDIFSHIIRIAEEEGYAAVLDGNNADDTGDWRPGQKAARELGVRSPLLEVGLTKAEIRAFSQQLGLPTWNKPASACLASRIPYGTPITTDSLSAVEQAEDYLHDLGFRQLRVRHHGKLARIEVAPEEMARFADRELCATITERLRSFGYQYVTLDLLGYRTGSLNELIVKK
jgi:uncharacterized protein